MNPKPFQIRAFTLLESLLVLTITASLLLLFSSALTKTVHVVRGELFVLRFENLYKDTQQNAALLSTRQKFTAQNGQLIYENRQLAIPEEAKCDDFAIEFDEKGGNSSLKKLKIFLPYENKTITYQLEMGSAKYKKTIR